MADKIESPAAKAAKARFFSKTFLVAITAICILGGITGGIAVTRYFFRGMFISAGVGNSFKAKPIFYPNETSLTIINALLEGAKEEILIMSYSITSKNILDVLAAKNTAGVNIRGIFDRNTTLEKGSPLEYMYKNGIREIFMDELPSSNQVIVVDKRYILIGSGAISTKAARESAGSFVIIDSVEVANVFREYFKTRLQKSRRIEL